jgi:NitT/TauT family transport system permease protein/sulfonate transport system permease protein
MSTSHVLPRQEGTSASGLRPFVSAVARRSTGLVTLIVLWQLLASIGFFNALLFPSPLTVAQALVDLMSDGSLLVDTLASLERVLVGFSVAAAVGMTLGVMLGWWPAAGEVAKPVVEALRPVPPIAWTPLAILWFGVGDAPSYFLVFIGAVFPVFINTFVAVRAIDRTQINAALCLGADRRLLLTDVIIPAALPMIFPGLRIALGVGWMCVVAAELIAAQSGLGYMIQQSRLMLQTPSVLAGMVTIGAIGYAMNSLMLLLERHLMPWRSETPS